ncbi:MAG: molecular chaperone HtpG [Clostridia bacterium]|nr:molecular chaperone HtpG [Clostridia bacterium]
MSDEMKKGGISVETEHIFPIIKKWLYSDKDIFLRELVSNACDAVTKLKRLNSLGHISLDNEDFRITVKVDKDEKTVTVSDNGIGMTAEELDKYLCNIALSGALDFIKKYEGEGENNGIIGHFGLGFYSAFMVASSVTVNTKSYTDAPAVLWECGENGEYTVSASDKTERGTDIILHIAENEEEYLSESKLKNILDRYCAFMPVEIYFEGEKEEEEKKPINDTLPLWMKNPSDCTEEEYNEFYHKVFGDFRDPLFHIHINADYPLNFKGILFFPKIGSEYESLEGQVKLYYNQVFVADNIKEVIPEFLLMLRGVIDCPELPLNVSRSYLQNSTYVSKVSKHIVKKVADKLNSLFNTEREKYENLWNDIKIFVEYGSLKDEKFYGRIKDSIVYPLTNGKTVTLDEYLESAKEKHENTVYYCTDKVSQAQYISMLENENISVAYLDKGLDNQFISMVEQDKKVKFYRVDSSLADALKGDGETSENEKLTELFKKVTGEKTKLRFESLKGNIPAILTVSEEHRRFGEMMKLYGMGDNIPTPEDELILNSNSETLSLLEKKYETDPEGAEKTAKQIYMLSALSQRGLSADELNEFLTLSYESINEGIK